MLFCAILAATPTDFDQAIRYEARGKDVTRIVADLAQVSGKKLETEGLKDWLLIVRFEKRPLSQVMDLIAAKTDAVWIQKDDRQILTRTKARREDALKREARHRGERMKKWLSSNFGLNEATRSWTDQEIETIVAQNKKIVEAKATGYLKMVKPDQVGIASTVTPAKILLQEFCRRISPETLGGLPIDSHLSFSTSPKAPEKPFPVNLGQALRSYITTRAAFAAKLPAEPPNLDGVTINSNDRQSLTPLDPNFVIRFELIRIGTETNIHAGVVVHGADRRTLLDTYGLEIQLDPLPVAPPPANLKGSVDFRPDSAAILQYMGKIRPVLGQAQGAKGGFSVSGAPIPPLPRPLLDKVADPAKYDPQSYFMADWLMSTAEALDVDLIASLPDSLFYNLSLALRGSSDLTALWKLASAWQLETKLEGGLLDVGPSDVARLDRYRIDRAALTKLLAAQTPESCPNWDDQALYAATQPVGTYQFGLDYRWMRLVDPNLVWSTNYFRPVAFRIWGTLDAETRQSARSTLPIDRLSSHQIALIYEMHRSYLGGISPRQLGDYMGGKRPDVYSDESETKIRDGSFTVEQKPTPMFLARYSNGAEAKLSAIELAWLLTAKKKSYLPAEAIPVSVRDMNAARVTYFFEHSAGNSQMPLDPNYGKFGAEEKLDPLSSGLQAKLEKVIEEWKDAKFVDSPGGNLNPPPPRR